MESYISVLEGIALQDMLLTIIALILCSAVILGVWGSFIYRITKTTKKRMTNKKKRERKQDIRKSVIVNCAATVFTVVLTVSFISVSQLDHNNYKADIEQKSFITYQGEFSIETNRTGRRYHQYVVLPSGDSIRIASIKHFFLRDGEYTGTVAYSENCNILVYIDKTTG